MDIDKLLKALDNNNNENIIDTTSNSLREELQDALKELGLEEEDTDELAHKLQNYKYIDNLSNLHSGAYIRWISLKNPDELYLTNGALLCDIKFDNEGVCLICKGFRNRHFQVRFDDCMIFQKLSDQEQVLLSALDYLSK
jgi:hypothetical protein